MIHDIYHDECKEDGYWHGFLFVPRATRAELLALLHRARKLTEYGGHLHYVKIGKETKRHHKKYLLAEAWTSVGCNALQQQKLQKYPIRVLLGRNPQRGAQAEYHHVASLLKCRFVLFRERDNHKTMYEGMTPRHRVETTFRMALKGGVHKLFSDSDRITIGNVFLDGDEQYFTVERTLLRLQYECRDHVSFAPDGQMIPQRSNHSQIAPNQHQDDSHLLQLCEVLIGGFRFHSCCGDRRHPRYEMSFHCKVLLDHEHNNSARMSESRYFKGFSLADAWLENGEWNFAPLTTKITPTKGVQEVLKLNS